MKKRNAFIAFIFCFTIMAFNRPCENLSIKMVTTRGPVEFVLRSPAHTFESSGGILKLNAIEMEKYKDQQFQCSFKTNAFQKLYVFPPELSGSKSIQEFCELSGTYTLKEKQVLTPL